MSQPKREAISLIQCSCERHGVIHKQRWKVSPRLPKTFTRKVSWKWNCLKPKINPSKGRQDNLQFVGAWPSKSSNLYFLGNQETFNIKSTIKTHDLWEFCFSTLLKRRCVMPKLVLPPLNQSAFKTFDVPRLWGRDLRSTIPRSYIRLRGFARSGKQPQLKVPPTNAVAGQEIPQPEWKETKSGNKVLCVLPFLNVNTTRAASC